MRSCESAFLRSRVRTMRAPAATGRSRIAVGSQRLAPKAAKVELGSVYQGRMAPSISATSEPARTHSTRVHVFKSARKRISHLPCDLDTKPAGLPPTRHLRAVLARDWPQLI